MLKGKKVVIIVLINLLSLLVLKKVVSQFKVIPKNSPFKIAFLLKPSLYSVELATAATCKIKITFSSSKENSYVMFRI